jgi:hypothetical protein
MRPAPPISVNLDSLLAASSALAWPLVFSFGGNISFSGF